MYRLINENVETLLAQENERDYVSRYAQIQERAQHLNVAADGDFQRAFRSYYSMNGARLSEEFFAKFFSIMEDMKSRKDVNVETVARQLLEIPCNARGDRRVHFSFSTKLAHTLRPTLPVYDDLVARFYFLRRPANGCATVRLAAYLDSQRYLVAEYHRVLTEGFLAASIAQFRARFSSGGTFTDEKIVDFLIWRFTAWLTNGALRDAEVEYR